MIADELLEAVRAEAVPDLASAALHVAAHDEVAALKAQKP